MTWVILIEFGIFFNIYIFFSSLLARRLGNGEAPSANWDVDKEFITKFACWSREKEENEEEKAKEPRLRITLSLQLRPATSLASTFVSPNEKKTEAEWEKY